MTVFRDRHPINMCDTTVFVGGKRFILGDAKCVTAQGIARMTSDKTLFQHKKTFGKIVRESVKLYLGKQSLGIEYPIPIGHPVLSEENVLLEHKSAKMMSDPFEQKSTRGWATWIVRVGDVYFASLLASQWEFYDEQFESFSAMFGGESELPKFIGHIVNDGFHFRLTPQLVIPLEGSDYPNCSCPHKFNHIVNMLYAVDTLASDGDKVCYVK